jgi:integrator complex subunit 11
MEVLVLGAGQDVGRSCVVVTIGGRRVMFDCGMHMGFSDSRRFPDFGMIGRVETLTAAIDCVIITHFHLDHIGALPHLVSVCGYEGPIYMTQPTAAISPILLRDYVHLMVDRRGMANFYTADDIDRCMARITPIALHETIWVDDELQITPYYAGHVLGAAMFLARCGGQSVLYTGDFNTSADRHLGAASVPLLSPDLIITESTYGNAIRESKRCREKDFLLHVHRAVAAGGKVLIPVNAVGRAQELLLLLESYWERMQLKAPIYFSEGMVQRANLYYKLFNSWTSSHVQHTAATTSHNPFDFRHVLPFEKTALKQLGPCVLFATPGMLHAGMALQAFREWGSDPKNLVLIPGYCVKVATQTRA